MFCYHCQETTDNTACTIQGACGKTEQVAGLQDLLLYVLKGMAIYNVEARKLGISDPDTDLFMAQALFSTLTNVNFDSKRFMLFIKETIVRRDALREKVYSAYESQNGEAFVKPLPEAATWFFVDGTVAEFEAKAATVGINANRHPDPDIHSMRELIIYGIKGLAAYGEHAAILDSTNSDLFGFVSTALAATTDDSLTVDDLVALALECGKWGVEAMALLDGANTTRYGHPEPTQVNLGVLDGPAILISGHDLRDLEDLLEQTAGTGVNVYTHGEMLPAHGYPFFKKYPHLVGNYGGAWWEQQKEFTTFNGPIVMTTNCLQKPLSKYADRIFTTGVVGWENTPHIAEREADERKDFSPVIEMALKSPSPEQLEEGTVWVGFARNAVLDRAEAVVNAVQSGAIKRFVVMAGCDGRQPERQYYTDVAAGLPKDAIILTAGCAKFRYNKLDLGDIGGIPRVLDAGQCNDSYSLVVVALKLAEVFGAESVNDLPISYDISWYEQKAVLVLLALLHLNVKKIHLGPTLPAFLSPNVTNLLVEHFDLRPIGSVEHDIEVMMLGQ